MLLTVTGPSGRTYEIADNQALLLAHAQVATCVTFLRAATGDAPVTAAWCEVTGRSAESRAILAARYALKCARIAIPEFAEWFLDEGGDPRQISIDRSYCKMAVKLGFTE